MHISPCLIPSVAPACIGLSESKLVMNGFHVFCSRNSWERWPNGLLTMVSKLFFLLLLYFIGFLIFLRKKARPLCSVVSAWDTNDWRSSPSSYTSTRVSCSSNSGKHKKIHFSLASKSEHELKVLRPTQIWNTLALVTSDLWTSSPLNTSQHLAALWAASIDDSATIKCYSVPGKHTDTTYSLTIRTCAYSQS